MSDHSNDVTIHGYKDFDEDGIDPWAALEASLNTANRLEGELRETRLSEGNMHDELGIKKDRILELEAELRETKPNGMHLG